MTLRSFTLLLRFITIIFFSHVGFLAVCQPASNEIGMGLGGIGGFSMEFVDASKTMRSFDGASLDENGYPQGDFQVVVFDMRPCCPWLGSVDDPNKFVPELMAGTYKLSFNGQANITSIGDPVSLQNKKYDAANNLTTLDLIVQDNNWLVNLSFTQTRRTAASSANTGITNIMLLRPGYHNQPDKIFRQEFINAVSHFPVIRFMDFVETNNSNPEFPEITEWVDRPLPSNAIFHGAPWEYVVELSNATQRDIWINIPVAASDDYVQQLAQLLKDKLHQGAIVYFEYSNEVWNAGFTQYDYNSAAAKAEVQAEIGGGASTTLNDDVSQCDPDDENLWAGRRYVKRMKEISDIFVETFSPGSRSSFEAKVRPVFSWQIGGWIPYYACILEWFEDVYGPAKDHFYGLAGAAYVNAEGAAGNASVAGLHAKMIANSDAGRGKLRDTPTAWWTGEGKIGLRQIADIYQIRLLQYETGPDNGGGSETNVANKIAANRDAGMKNVLLHDLGTNWFDDDLINGDLVMYFVLASSYTRYGSWGATEEVENMHTPKLRAVYEIGGIVEDNEGPSHPGNVNVTMSGLDAIVTWEEAEDNVAVTHYRISDNSGVLATVLASETLSVTLANYPTANIGSINVIAFDAFNNPSGFGTVTGVGGTELFGDVSIFPNPFIERIVVKIDRTFAGRTVTISDVLGREMFKRQVSSSGHCEFSLEDLPAGIYLVMVSTSSGQTYCRKIVKQ